MVLRWAYLHTKIDCILHNLHHKTTLLCNCDKARQLEVNDIEVEVQLGSLQKEGPLHL